MRKIKISAVINDLLIGGSQNILFNIFAQLDRNSFDREVIYLYDFGAQGRSTFEREFKALCPIVNLGGEKKPSAFSSFLRLYRHFRKERPDIVQCYLPNSVILATFAARLAGVPSIIIHEQNTHKFYSRKLEWAFRFARFFATLTITYSETLEDELFGTNCVLTAPVEKVSRASYTVYNGIDLAKVEEVKRATNRHAKRSELGLSDSDILVFSAARLIDWKGYEYLIEAVAKIRHKLENVKVLIAGEGPEEEKLRNLIEKHHLHDVVHLIGPRTDVFEILAVSDIYPQAYAYPEGFSSISIGMSGMEAMAFGLPIIISLYPAIYHGITDAENVRIVKPRDPDGLAEALLSLSTDKEERERIGRNAEAYVQEFFSTKASGAIYESIYRALVRQR